MHRLQSGGGNSWRQQKVKSDNIGKEDMGCFRNNCIKTGKHNPGRRNWTSRSHKLNSDIRLALPISLLYNWRTTEVSFVLSLEPLCGVRLTQDTPHSCTHTDTCITKKKNLKNSHSLHWGKNISWQHRKLWRLISCSSRGSGASTALVCMSKVRALLQFPKA